jgi:hypothetical protein
MRQTVRVLAREGLRVRPANHAGDIVKFQLITSEGLFDERTQTTTPGPVEVPLTRYFARLLAAGSLVRAEAAEGHGHAPAAPDEAPDLDGAGDATRVKPRRTEG